MDLSSKRAVRPALLYAGLGGKQLETSTTDQELTGL